MKSYEEVDADIRNILGGIDMTESEEENGHYGWWLTSFGADGGAETLKDVLDYIKATFYEPPEA